MKTRRCQWLKCNTILNSFNKTKFCAAHRMKHLLQEAKEEAGKEHEKSEALDLGGKRVIRISRWMNKPEKLFYMSEYFADGECEIHNYQNRYVSSWAMMRIV